MSYSSVSSIITTAHSKITNNLNISTAAFTTQPIIYSVGNSINIRKHHCHKEVWALSVGAINVVARNGRRFNGSFN
jgi:hypothetical protein